MTDCGSPNALWFFPVVLVMTNYVMLNLFVGMIMNNFAYISTKDGNGAVEDEHFVDAAFKYVENLDPTLKGQIPIGQVRSRVVVKCMLPMRLDCVYLGMPLWWSIAFFHPSVDDHVADTKAAKPACILT